MLRDPRANALVDRFATRWLELSKIAGFVPDTELYPEFDENLREAMAAGDEAVRRRSASAGSQRCGFAARRLHVRERSAGAALRHPERLRQPLSAGEVHRSPARRAARTGERAGGDVVSEPHVGRDPRPLAAGEHARRAAAAAAARCAGAEGTRRRKGSRSRCASGWKLHRKNPACASCHQRMDPLGFSLENFDAVGKWRAEAMACPSTRPRRCPTARSSPGSKGCARYLVDHKEDFVRTLSGKLLAYAIGRGIEYYDQPAIRKIAREAARERLSLVVGHPGSSAALRSACGQWREARRRRARVESRNEERA